MKETKKICDNKVFIRFLKYFIYSSLIILVIVCSVYYIEKYNLYVFDYGKIQNNIYNISLTLSVSLLGFLITSLAIIISFFNNSIMQKFNQTEGFDNLILTFKYTFRSLLLTIFLLIIFSSIQSYFVIIFLLLSLLLDLFAINRCVKVIFMIIKHIKKS